jgi:Alanine racemase, N-terminal domain
MSLSLYVHGDRWRTHLRAVTDAHPGIVPVAKGNGYGFGVPRLARRAEWLGCDQMAVGTYDEAPEALKRFPGDVLVLAPWRPFSRAPHDSRLVHTVGRAEDLKALAAAGGPDRGAGRAGRPRVVLEGLTSMRRHGMTPEELRGLDLSGVSVEGLALHLPMPVGRSAGRAAGGHVAETERWLVVARDLEVSDQLYVSHLGDGEIAEVGGRHPGLRLRPRIGTALWLGDRAALSPRATVLDVHPVAAGERVGYRQRRIPRSGYVLVVSGGTAHGIGLEAPTAATTVRSRAVAAARGSLDAAGLALSPFRVGGRQRWFVEPPHMQVSMLFVPDGVAVPVVGDEIGLEVRFTTTHFDRVVVS